MSPSPQPERLHKYIAGCGYCSRRRAEELIHAGKVTVNGERVTQLGSKVTPGQDVVAIHGEKLQPPARLTVVLNKPPGCLTTMHDPQGRPLAIAEGHVIRQLF